tara:strand:- start:355 stop:675 length:321 start_codon:yes stop_codon:yes gene_type:complete
MDISERLAKLEESEAWKKIPAETQEKMRKRALLKEGDVDLDGNVVVIPKNANEWFKTQEDEDWWAEYCEDRANANYIDIMAEFFERGATKTQALKSLEELKEKATN